MSANPANIFERFEARRHRNFAMCILQAGRQSDRKMMELKGEKKA
ncbi:DUF3789 domain-containing protein [Firmicutes bacterium AM41-5BH]|nr:DUF3789 domain-containing protein [Firmicutes bacterium AM41-5BH]